MPIHHSALVCNVALLVATGAAFGLHAPLARIAALQIDRPLGLAFWVNALMALICLTVVRVRRPLPRLTRERLRFVLWWGLVGAALAEALLFVVATTLPATLLSLVLGLEGFLVYLVAATTRQEPHSVRRIVGLALGLAAVALLAGIDRPDPSMLFWLVVALLVPATYAFEDLLLAAGLPRRFDPLAAIGYASVVAALALGLLAVATHEMVPLRSLLSEAGAAVLLMAASSSLGTWLLYRLLDTTGAVFGSQSGQVITMAGVVWSLVLLGERPAFAFWPALVLIVVGLALIQPRTSTLPEAPAIAR